MRINEDVIKIPTDSSTVIEINPNETDKNKNDIIKPKVNFGFYQFIFFIFLINFFTVYSVLFLFCYFYVEESLCVYKLERACDN